MTSNIISISQAITNETQVQAPQPPQDFITYLFNNSLTSMLLSTFVIAIIGVLINKLRNFKKKLEMVEILAKALTKMKKQADEREAKLTLELNEMRRMIGNIDDKVDRVKDEATKALIDYLSRKKD